MFQIAILPFPETFSSTFTDPNISPVKSMLFFSLIENHPLLDSGFLHPHDKLFPYLRFLALTVLIVPQSQRHLYIRSPFLLSASCNTVQLVPGTLSPGTKTIFFPPMHITYLIQTSSITSPSNEK